MLFPLLPSLAVCWAPVIFRQWRGKIGILTSNTDENNSHNKIGMKNAGVVIIRFYLTPEEIVFREPSKFVKESFHLGFYKAGVGTFWKQGEFAGASDNTPLSDGTPGRISLLSLDSVAVEKLGMQALGATSLLWSTWQQPSVENILGYISNNLNQLAKSTKFLLLCLALKFLQTWLNRQERVIKLNLWNKNRPFGTSHTHTQQGCQNRFHFFMFQIVLCLVHTLVGLRRHRGVGVFSLHSESIMDGSWVQGLQLWGFHLYVKQQLRLSTTSPFL